MRCLGARCHGCARRQGPKCNLGCRPVLAATQSLLDTKCCCSSAQITLNEDEHSRVGRQAITKIPAGGKAVNLPSALILRSLLFLSAKDGLC